MCIKEEYKGRVLKDNNALDNCDILFYYKKNFELKQNISLTKNLLKTLKPSNVSILAIRIKQVSTSLQMTEKTLNLNAEC